MATIVAATRGSRWTHPTIVAGLLTVSFGILGGALSGLALDGVSLSVGFVGRQALAPAGALACLVAAARGRPPLQRNRETPRRWLRYRDVRTAALNGLTLGSGVWTRLTVWTFYAIPIAGMARGRAGYGAAVFATYGLIRLLSSWALASGRVRPIAMRHCTTTLADVVHRLDLFAAGFFIVLAASLAFVL